MRHSEAFERHHVPGGTSRSGRSRLDAILIELRTLAARIETAGAIQEKNREEALSAGRAGLQIPDLCNPLPFYARGTSEEGRFDPVSIERTASRN